jgi:hypothetical protein
MEYMGKILRQKYRTCAGKSTVFMPETQVVTFGHGWQERTEEQGSLHIHFARREEILSRIKNW